MKLDLKLKMIATLVKRFNKVDEKIKTLYESATGNDEKVLSFKTALDKFSDEVIEDRRSKKRFDEELRILNRSMKTLSANNKQILLKELEKPQKGDDGLSAYQLWLEKGNKGTELEFLESLKGEDGEDGEDGRGIEKMFINPKKHWIVIYTDGTRVDMGKIVSDENLFKGGGGGISIHTVQKLLNDFVPYTGATSSVDLGIHNFTTTGNISGTWTGDVIPILKGGSGETTANAALNAFLPSQPGNGGKVLQTNGMDTSLQDDTNFTRIEQAFTSQSSITVTHNNGYRPGVDVIDPSTNERIPFNIAQTTVNQFTVTFSSAQTGTIIYDSSGFVASPLGNFIKIDVTDSPYIVDGTEAGISVDASGGDVVINLLTLILAPVRRLKIEKNEASVNTVTVNRAGTDLINGEISKIIRRESEGYDFTPFPTEWRFIENDSIPNVKSISFTDSPYLIKLTDDIIYVDCTGGVTVTRLPALALGRKKPYDIIKIDASGNDVHLQGNGSELINGVNIQPIGIQYDTLRPQNRLNIEWGLL